MLFLVFLSLASANNCGIREGTWPFEDARDGDVKKITFTNTSTGFSVKIFQHKPVAWSLTAKLDQACTAEIDFSKSKKPSHPSVPLLAAFKATDSGTSFLDRFLVEFTDPTKTLGTGVLNMWATERTTAARQLPCADFPATQFQDMHDGDMKTVSVSNGMLTLGQAGIWNLTTAISSSYPDKSCQATVNFNKTDKPAKPPVPLVVQLAPIYNDHGAIVMIWTDPTKTVSKKKDRPINVWESIRPSPTPSPTPIPSPTPSPPKGPCPTVGGSTGCCLRTVAATDTCKTLGSFYDTSDVDIKHADGRTICSDQFAPPTAGEQLTVCPNYRCDSMTHTCEGGAADLKSAGTMSKLECALNCK
jgi:hypothetical protein